MYNDKLGDIVNGNDNAYNKAIKMKPVDVKDNTYINFDKKNLLIKTLNFTLLILLEYQNAKTFLLMYVLQIGLKRFL